MLKQTVIDNDYCIGCGVCTYPEGSPFKTKMDEYGKMVAYLEETINDTFEGSYQELCPFSNKSYNEDQISSEIFDDSFQYNRQIGSYLSCHAGYVGDKEFRAHGSSGGIAKWLGYKLLELKEVDYFIQLSQANPDKNDGKLFQYQIFDNKEDVICGSKSAYYPTTLSDILEVITEKEGRYAITAVPCNIKAIRLLSKKYPVIKDRLTYTFGLVCGGMKTGNYAKLIGWELGIFPDDLGRIDFRKKYTDRPANQKLVQVWNKKGDRTIFKDVGQIYGTGYAAGFFKPKPCDYCDDVLGETADISIGDAWLRDFVKDPKGNSLVIIRNKKLKRIIDSAVAKKELSLTEITAEEAAMAQAGGLRHRRDGLSRRLEKKHKKGEWVPLKRVKPGEFKITVRRKMIYDIREIIANKSHLAFLQAYKKGSLKIFHKRMNPIIAMFAVVNFWELLPSIPRRIKLFVFDKWKIRD